MGKMIVAQPQGTYKYAMLENSRYLITPITQFYRLNQSPDSLAFRKLPN
jgi:hypothetical protein